MSPAITTVQPSPAGLAAFRRAVEAQEEVVRLKARLEDIEAGESPDLAGKVGLLTRQVASLEDRVVQLATAIGVTLVDLDETTRQKQVFELLKLIRELEEPDVAAEGARDPSTEPATVAKIDGARKKQSPRS